MSDAETPIRQYRPFVLFWCARAAASLALQMQVVAVGWQVYEMTRDPLHLGLIGLSQFLPFILLILPAGYAADHLDRRRIVTFCYCVQALSAGLLLALTLAGMRSIGFVFAVKASRYCTNRRELAGMGITHPFSLISQEGALMSLGGVNTFSGTIQLNGVVGIGVELLGPSSASELTLTGFMSDFLYPCASG